MLVLCAAAVPAVVVSQPGWSFLAIVLEVLVDVAPRVFVVGVDDLVVLDPSSVAFGVVLWPEWC